MATRRKQKMIGKTHLKGGLVGVAIIAAASRIPMARRWIMGG